MWRVTSSPMTNPNRVFSKHGTQAHGKNIFIPRAELEYFGIIKTKLGDSIEVGEGAKGTRIVSDVIRLNLTSDCINADLATNDAADWLTISENGALGALDVRFTLRTDDGAFIYVEYSGR